MKYKLEDLIDIKQFQLLQDKLNEIYAFPSAIIDSEGKLLTATGWQDVCTKFHRVHPECRKLCVQSDMFINDHLSEADPAVSYTCPHGLVDNCAPIIIEGVHYGNYFTGQFFADPPDFEFFREQAKKYGFDEAEYLEAVKKVPVWPREKLNSYIFFIKGLIEVITSIGLRNLKAAEAKKIIAESEEKYRSVFELAPTGIILLAEDFKIIEANKTFCEITGYTEQELLNMDVMEVTHPDDVELSKYYTAKLLKGETDIIVFEKRYIRKSGETVWVRVRSIIRKDENNLPLNFISHIQDITERKKALEVLRESEERFRIVAECSGVCVWEVDKDGLYTYLSPNEESILGYKPEEIVGKKYFYDFFVENVREELKKAAFEIFRRQEHFNNFINPNIHKNGSVVYLETSGVPVLDAEGNLTGYRGADRDVTERKLAEKTIKEREKNYREIFESTNEAIFVIDPDTSFLIDVNNAMVSMFGYTAKEEVLGNPQIELLPGVEPYTAETARTIFAKSKDAGTQTFEWLARKMDRSLLWIEVSMKRAVINGKEVVLSVCRDITQRKESEKALEHSRNLMDYIIEHNRSAVAVFDCNMNYIYVSKSYYQQYGLKIENIIGMNHYEIFPEIPQRWKDIHKRCLRGETISADEDPFYREDGKIDWIQWEIRPWNEIDGSIGGIILYSEVITERINMEQKLRESEELFKSVVHNSIELTILTDIEGTVYYVGPQCREVVGYPQEKFIGIKSPNIIYPEDKDKAREIYTSLLEKGSEISEYEYRIVDENGGIRWVSHSAKFIRIGEKLHGIQNTIRNITESKIAQEELERHRNHLEDLVEQRTEELDALNRELLVQIFKKQEAEDAMKNSLEKEKELNQLKSRFISTASHEFKTPLTAVLSSAELLQRYGDKWSSEKLAAHIERIKNSVQHLSKLVDDVLTLSRADSGKTEFNPVDVDLPEFCGKLLEEMRISASEKHSISLNYRTPRKSFLLDQKQLYIIIQNLISNAIKYSPDGGKIEISISSDPENVILRVSDEGLGIPEEDLERLYEPFHRAANIGTIEGTGLGLSILKKAVELHKGHVKVKSEVGKGSVFTVELPFSQPDNGGPFPGAK